MRTLSHAEIHAVSGSATQASASQSPFVKTLTFFFASFIYTLTGKVPSWYVFEY